MAVAFLCSTRYLWNVFFSKDYNTNNGILQGDLLSPIISVLYLSLVLKMLFPFPSSSVSCLSFIDDFMLVINNPHLHENVSQLEAAFMRFDEIMSLIGFHFELKKTELMHFASKMQEV